ncbi:MAG: glycosyl hydrolase family 25 [Paraprevotella sp.]|nr:glycosyl hydrolase family 25 [Paraprevotella sp.]
MKRKKWKWIFWGGAMLVLAGIWALCFRPATDGQCLEGITESRTVSCYALEVPGVDTLFFAGADRDSLLDGLSARREQACRTFYAHAFFVSYSGRLLTVADSMERPEEMRRRTLLPLLRKEASAVSERMEVYRQMLAEMDYYARTHSVVDEGFHQVMAHNEDIKARYEDLKQCQRTIDTVLKGADVRARLQAERTVQVRNASGSSSWVKARLLCQEVRGVAVWQTADKQLPSGIVRFRLNPVPYTGLHLSSHRYVLWGYWGHHKFGGQLPDSVASAIRVRMENGKPEIPLVDGVDGAPVFGRWGNLNGMWVYGRLYTAPRLYVSALAHDIWFRCLWEDLKGWSVRLWKDVLSLWGRLTHEKGGAKGAELGVSVGQLSRNLLSGDYGFYTQGGRTFYGQLSHGRPDGDGVMRYPDKTVYSGRWKQGRREGFGVYTDTLGRTFSGKWQTDSLPRGRRRDADGLYTGFFDSHLEAHGEGTYQTDGGGYYVGKWKNGRLDGFGFALFPGEVVKCGVWARGAFKGEQMLYHSDRVYGIDISKHQHVIRRRTYGIDWRRLRITNLGHISRKKVQGQVDYPVSFVYIKCTEGQTVLNPYYLRDVRSARRMGFPVGAYHFFSMRPAVRQAAYFLRMADLRRGDLPPMLDVELTDRQIMAMGGKERLFHEMLIWLRIVGRRSGTTPILYIGQDFVNRYLLSAPEELKAYPVWIARYGEYKPYVHLLYWQLSPDGRVEGIKGEVDIDVFNGTEEQFKKYLRTQTVR